VALNAEYLSAFDLWLRPMSLRVAFPISSYPTRVFCFLVKMSS